MNLTFHVHKLSNCKLNIKDLSYDEGVYLDEDANIPGSVVNYYELDKFKYSETYTVNIIKKVTTTEEKVVKVLFTEHDLETLLDEAYFTPEIDGYYIIYHYVLPSEMFFISEQWQHSDKDKQMYFTDGQNIYKLNNLVQEEIISPEDFIELENDLEDTSISLKVEGIFTTCYLFDCYINLCRQIFNTTDCRDACKTDINSDLVFKRDFVWMTFNIIKYLVEKNQLLEAQRILEVLMQCNQFCNSTPEFNKGKDCGCGCKK